ncbi:MAG: right-handed parallel beta-helix repeat-containing protein [Kiritimatiellae bacterium]|nr:right-handed parallel beta-helix repeat-containing protein [Kiritimatiellia bacterium]
MKAIQAVGRARGRSGFARVLLSTAILFHGGWAVFGASYYVNDGSTNGDVYCSVAGSDAFSGNTPAAPKLTVTNLLATRSLAAGDIVYIDTGTYSNYTVTITNSGASGNPIIFQGSTNYAYGGSVFERNHSGADVFLVAVNYIDLRHLTLTKGRSGVQFDGAPIGHQVRFVRAQYNSLYGFHHSGSGDAVYRNCVAFSNTTAGMRSFLSTIFWDRGVMYGQPTHFQLETQQSASGGVSNSMMGAGTAFSQFIPMGDYNIFWGGIPHGDYRFLSALQGGVTSYWNSTVRDPLLANPGAGDFHPRSLGGRYDPGIGGYTNDSAHSPLVDFGDPASAYADEPDPNGQRVNAGAYGNSSWASKSQTNAWLLTLSYPDAGTLYQTGRLTWTYGNIPTSETVRLQYSPDNRATWVNIVTNLAVTNRTYLWNASSATSTPVAWWRVVREANTNVFDACPTNFALRGLTPVMYYVNDAVTNGDVYTTAAGAEGQDGLTPATPKNSIQGVLAAYPVSADHIIYVDTGTYTGQTATVSSSYGGRSNLVMTIQGSTNAAAGGTVLDRRSAASDVLVLQGANWVRVRDLTVAGGRYGVWLVGASRATLERVTARGNVNGFQGNSASDHTFLRCAAAHNTVGVNGFVDRIAWDYGVCWSNTTAFFPSTPAQWSVSNTVIVGGTAFAGATPPGAGDYNIFWNTVLHASYPNLALMQDGLSGWWNCTVRDPLFADPARTNFHPRSVTGTRSNGVWVVYTNHSPMIDFGPPSAPYANEPWPNGTNVNIGVYGNTAEASKSRTNAWLLALSYNDGGVLNAELGDRVYWRAGNMAAGATVRIELSRDGGTSWEVVETNVSAATGYYDWASTNFASSRLSRWRVVYEADTNVISATTRTNFTYQYGRYEYYLNDPSQDGDVYCSAPGSDANAGTSAGAPKLTLQSLLAAHEVQAGDIIFMDTGTYVFNSVQEIGALYSGVSNAPVEIQGSTNELAGGTVITRSGLRLNNAAWYAIRDLVITNVGAGIQLAGSTGTRLSRVSVRRAGTGFDIQGSAGVWLDQCVAANCSSNGVAVGGESSLVQFGRGVLWANRFGVRVTAGRVVLSNSAVAVQAPDAYAYHAATATNIWGNYNALHAASNAVIGYIGTLNRNLDSLADWTAESGQESRSLEADPRFADPGDGDFHPQTNQRDGRWIPGVGWNPGFDTVTSPLIDAGDPAAAFTNETAYNGLRINIGLYGNTAEASKRSASNWLYAASLREGGWVRGTSTLHWVAGGAATGHLLKVEFSGNGGRTWTTLTNGVPAATELFAWNTRASADTPAGLWRVVSVTEPALSDQATNFFSVRNLPLTIYLNDSSTNGDVYCTAPGNATNWEASVSAPMIDLASALARYDLEPGDQVRLDTGTYTSLVDAVISRKRSGSEAAALRILGSTNDAAGGSLLVRGGSGSSRIALSAFYARWTAVSNLALQGAETGARIEQSANVFFSGLRSSGHSGAGVEVRYSTNVTFRHSASHHNTGLGLLGQQADGLQWHQSVVWSNTAGGVYLAAGDAAITNSVIEASGSGKVVYTLASNALLKANYNDVLAHAGATLGIAGLYTARDMARWREISTNDLFSLTHPPLFADPLLGNFRPRSKAGRYNPSTGAFDILDGQTSPLLDAGNPSWAFSQEPVPNGSRINIGPYGHHPQASLSPTNGWLLVLSLNDGGSIRGTNDIYWLAGGATTGRLVTIQYSWDGGMTWTNLATNVSAAAGVWNWATDLVPSTPRGGLRFVDETDTSITASNAVFFTVNNAPLTYYINDASTNGDVYCNAPGSSAHDGISPDYPLDSLSTLLSRYYFKEGDRVFVDTGTYYPPSTITIGASIVGAATNTVLIQGSTNEAAGGTVMDFQGKATGIRVENTAGIELKRLTVRRAGSGIFFYVVTNCFAEWTRVEAGGYGYEVEASRNVLLDHAVAMNATTCGLHNVRSTNTVWQNGVLWSNRVGVLLASSPRGNLDIPPPQNRVVMSNSIASVWGSAARLYSIQSGALAADYNGIHLAGGAYVAERTMPIFNDLFDSVERWRVGSTQDVNSLSGDPGFFDAGAGDFHLKSVAGRYDPSAGVFVTGDTESSRLLDAGLATAPYVEEPDPNGRRVNIGLYANTAWASKTPTASVLKVISLNDGGVASGAAVPLRWLAGGDATGHTVRLDFSWNSGTNWQVIATGLPATNGIYTWNTTGFTSSLFGVWRVQSEIQPAVWGRNDTPFALRNTNFLFYVNDTNPTGDVYTSATGSSTNSGLREGQPKPSVQSIVDAYDLEAGDTVYVDTGVYTGSAAVVSIGQADGGRRDDPLLLEVRGSTNYGAGGTVLQVAGQPAGVRVTSAAGVKLQDLFLDGGARTNVLVAQAKDVRLERVIARGGAVGFLAGGAADTTLRNCAASDMTSVGLFNGSSSNTLWTGGVLWSNRVGVLLSSWLGSTLINSLAVSNSVIAAWGPSSYAYQGNDAALRADYNDIVLREGARAALRPTLWIPEIVDTASRWAWLTGLDAHSLSHEPLFADPVAGDFHPRSQGGRFSRATTNYVYSDTNTSVLIDAGGPGDDFSVEPAPNGLRLNIGLHGNSAEASLTPTNARLTVVSLNDGGRAQGTAQPLYWLAGGEATGHTVKISFSWNGGQTWVVLTNGLPAAAGVFSWDTTLQPSTMLGVWEVRSEANTNVWARSQTVFALRNAPFSFYVNDASTNGDVYAAGPGHATNSGLSAEAPQLSLQTVLDAWDLEEGDVVYVDTGFYTSRNGTVIGQLDAGNYSNSIPVVIQGSTNEAAGGSVFVGNGGTNGFHLYETDAVSLRHLLLRGYITGVRLTTARRCSTEWVRVEDGTTGFQVSESSEADFRHCVARGLSGAGLSVASPGVDWESGILWSNATALYVASGSASMMETVAGAFGSNSYVYSYDPVGGNVSADYNALYLGDGAQAAYLSASPLPAIYDSVSRWTRATGQDQATLTRDPLFVDAGTGDFHLKSQAGRYSVALTNWVPDAESSPLLDAGDPSSTWTNETAPNGFRRNIGLYGDAAQASRTPTNAVLTVISLNDGGRAEGVIPLFWLARGVATGHTVRLDYSADAGASWSLIASNVPAASGVYVWDSQSYTSSIRGVWRVWSEQDLSAWDQTAALFALRNERLNFYVNDPVTNGDVYTAARGSALNTGTLPSSPLNAVQAVLDMWDLEPGDTVFVDTGEYTVSDAIRIGRLDAFDGTNLALLAQGIETNFVVFHGSTNEAASGSVFTRFGAGDLFYLDSAPGTWLRHFTLREGATGLSAYRAHYGRAEWVYAENGADGFELQETDYFDMRHCVSRNNAGRGLALADTRGVAWRSGVLWSNNLGTYVDSADIGIHVMTLENSVIGVFGQDALAHVYKQGVVVSSDYNNIYLAENALAGGLLTGGGRTSRYESVHAWGAFTRTEPHTLTEDPKFANAGQGDFHLRTTRPSGRYDPLLGTWTNDNDFSKLIDSGNPSSSYFNEPIPSGARINIGLYGNTWQASQTPTNAWLTLITLNDGGSIQGTQTLYWVAGGAAAGHSLYIDYNRLSGLNYWTNIATNLLGSSGAYVWDLAPFERTAAGEWRLISALDPDLVVTSRVPFTLRDASGSIWYFVNDSSTNGNIYTTVPGHASLRGTTPYWPKASIQDVLNTYRLEPWDIIFVDTGEYLLTDDIGINDLDSGSGTNRVTIQGSTNWLAGGTVLNRQISGGNTAVIRLKAAAGINLRDLTLRSAATGMEALQSEDCTFQNVRFIANGSKGMRLEEASGFEFSGCTVWQNGGSGGVGIESEKSDLLWINGVIWGNANAVDLSSAGSHEWRNSVFQASGYGRRVFQMDPTTSPSSMTANYNNYQIEDSAILAEKETLVGGSDLYGNLTEWQAAGLDPESLSHDPLFADPDNGDFRLRSKAGRFRLDGTITNDTVTSPMIDTGDPASAWTNELDPNGQRINIGAYGNTPLASLSPTNPWLLAISLNAGGIVRGTSDLVWASGNLSTGALVRLEYTRNNGVEWFLIASNVVNGTGRYAWDLSAQPVTVQGGWRVIYQADTNVADACDTPFIIKNEVLKIYVNDASLLNDVYCKAPGSPAHSGLSSNSPLNDPVAAMSTYPLTAGDTLYIDTGEYNLSTNLFLGELNRGLASMSIRILGSTNGSLLVRNNNFRSGLVVNDTRYIEISDLKITVAGEGVEVENVEQITFRRLESYKNRTGIDASGMQGAFFDRCLVWSNRTWGFILEGQSDAAWDRSVFSENRSGAIQANVGSVAISNSILYGAGTSVLYSVSLSPVNADFNVLWNEGAAVLARDAYGEYDHLTLQSWQRTMNADAHSVRVDPLLAAGGMGDFHLQSQAGRWSPTLATWINDAQTSWAIDAGAANGPFGNELNPNGGRMNAGRYANSGQASKSNTNAADRALLIASLDDGGLVPGTKELYWLSRGLTAADLVTLEYSPDNGGAWNTVVSNLPATQAGYYWDATELPSTPLARWRVVLQSDTNLFDVNAKPFILRNGPIPFYVNDADTNNDVYCTAPGHPTNTGLSASTPLDTLHAVLQYDLEGGDTLYVDTGLYPVTNTIEFTSLHSGAATSRVRVVGSTYGDGTGTVFRGQFAPFAGGVGMTFVLANYIELSNFVLENLDTSIESTLFSSGNLFRNLQLRGGGQYGFFLQTAGTRIENCVVTRGSGSVLNNVLAETVVEGCVLWSNGAPAVVLEKGTLMISNSVLSVDGITNVCLMVSTGSVILANYNNYYLANDASLAEYEDTVYEKLFQWNQRTLQDLNSLSVDPLFADAAGDDYHLRSVAGRWVPGAGWTNDLEHSLLIDTGAPDSPYALEPEPNGSRRNIGLYGNTGEASKGLTNQWLLALTGSSGGRGEGLVLLTWAGLADTPTNTVRLDYSFDNGGTWSPMANNVLLAEGGYFWNSLSWPFSPIARWRIVLESDTNVWDATDSSFAINGPFNFYLNDTNPVGDIYTTAPGSDTNLGIYFSIPMATLRHLLETYDLEGGDIIWMDTGLYSLTTNDLVQWTTADQGLRSAPVELRGNTNSLATVIHNVSGDPNPFTVEARYVRMRDLVLQQSPLQVSGGGVQLLNLFATNGNVSLSGNGQTAEVLRVENGTVSAAGLYNTLTRLSVKQGSVSLSGTNVWLLNSLVAGSANPAVSLAGGEMKVQNNTLVGTGTQIRKTGLGNAFLTNNIVVADGVDRFCIQWLEGLIQSDYNNLVARNGAWIGNRIGWWEKLLYWQRATGLDAHSLSVDPLFADEAGGDYHLQSAMGRWTPSGWTNDADYSPCIDMGDPFTASWTNEPIPAGDRVNLGAYGGTEQASKSPPGAQLMALTVGDGGVLKGTNIIRWTSVNLGPGDLVRLEYSTNNFASSVTIAASIPSSEGQYSWDTTLVPSSLFAWWRVVLETNTAVEGRTEQSFAVRNTPLPFYVNDSNTLNDVYTTQRGSDTNNGLSPATPMASLATLLNTYDTEGGDVVYMDTGFYTNTSSLRVIWSRGGESAYGPVTIQGSTNYAAKGTVLIRSGAPLTPGLDVKASHMTFRDLTVARNLNGMLLETNAAITVERVLAMSNAYGVVAVSSDGLTVRNSRFWNNNQGGFWLEGVRTARVEHCTLVSASGTSGSIQATNTVGVTLQNNIFYFSSSNGVALYFSNSNVLNSSTVDYNSYYFGAEPGAIAGAYSNLMDWQLAVNKDFRSAITNPLFANLGEGDFHLQSAAGRWVDGSGWTTDAESSWAIDKANPVSSWTNEPTPNGFRANLGAYGGTVHASKGDDTPALYARTLNQSLFIGESNSVQPLIWHARNVPTNTTVAVQYSGDGGATWTTISNNVPAYREYIVWPTTPYYNTYGGFWRVVGITDTNYWDVNNEPFQIFFGEFAISRQYRQPPLNRIIWRGAWNAEYQVQLATNVSLTTNVLSYIYTNLVGTNVVVGTNKWREIVIHWTNAPTGTGTYQQANFISTLGGDLTYEDPESSNRRYRLYHVIQK